MGPTNASSTPARRRMFRAAMLAISALILGCGARVVVDGDAGTLGTGAAGAGGTTGVGGGLPQDGGNCVLTTYTTGNQTHTPECFAPPAGGCPNQYDAVLHIVPSTPCVYLVGVNCGPVVVDGDCCYMVTEEPKPTCGG